MSAENVPLPSGGVSQGLAVTFRVGPSLLRSCTSSKRGLGSECFWRCRRATTEFTRMEASRRRLRR